MNPLTGMDVTPYSSVLPFGDANLMPTWLPLEEAQRIQAYNVYDNMYWNAPETFKITWRGAEDKPIYVPNPRRIVDATAHYLFKGVHLVAPGGAQEYLDSFLKREEFYSRWMLNKHAGVVRGDHIFHLTVDESKEEGRRLSLTTVDPGSYFPVWDEDDLNRRIGVHLAEAFESEEFRTTVVKRLSYLIVQEGGRRRIEISEGLYDARDYTNPQGPRLLRQLQPPRLLPESITSIPVYHIRNLQWQGDPYGSSELRGYETLLGSVNQTISDTQLALALEGLGVYATDGGSPVDENGDETPWVIAPAKVMEVPSGAYFKRVEGITSVVPALDFVKYAEGALDAASATFNMNQVDITVAPSGISLALKFLPTLAKLEQRELAGTTALQQMYFDWSFWVDEYEGAGGAVIDPGLEIEVALGDKLPQDRDKLVTELNNMFDRHVISRRYYRKKMKELGYDFPTDSAMEKEIQEEFEAIDAKFATTKSNIDSGQLGGGDVNNPNAPTVPKKNQSNNSGRTNESNGTESRQSTKAQERPAARR